MKARSWTFEEAEADEGCAGHVSAFKGNQADCSEVLRLGARFDVRAAMICANLCLLRQMRSSRSAYDDVVRRLIDSETCLMAQRGCPSKPAKFRPNPVAVVRYAVQDRHKACRRDRARSE